MMKFSEMPYERITYETMEEDFHKIMKEFKLANSGEEQFRIHKKYYELSDNIQTMMALARTRFNINMEDTFYSKEKEYYDEIAPKLNKLEVEYSDLLFSSNYRTQLEEYIGKVAFKNMELRKKSFDEAIIGLMQEENVLVTKYLKLLATAKIEWNDETISLSFAAKYMMDSDRNVRKEIAHKRSEWFLAHEEELDTIYDQLVKNRDQQAKLLGYENYIELGYQRMSRNCYDKEMVKQYREQVKQYLVPFSEKLHEERRKRLGLEKLYGYDESVSFPNGNPTPNMKADELLKTGQVMYENLSKETKEFYDFMLEHQLFDVVPRTAKRSGGYMTYFPMYHAPFVFANFNGSSYDVKVITHECGHAFQGYLSGQDPIREHADITMETAEIHSMAMEFFTEPYMNLFFSDRSEDYKRYHLENAVTFIPYGCIVDEFQHEVYAHPEMTPDERKEVWKRLEEEYRPHVDYTGDAYLEKGCFWQKQHHIYASPFYYIDYCLAQTCALQYKAWMDEDYKVAWESYLRLCKLSASDFYTEMLKKVSLKSPFEDGTIQYIVQKLEEKIK